MKKLIIIFTSVFFLSLVGFVITAAVAGVNFIENGFSIFPGFNEEWDSYDASETFGSDYNNIEISVLVARTEIGVSPDGITRVSYSGNRNYRNVEFSAEIKGDTLYITEKGTWGRGWNWGWNWNFFDNNWGRGNNGRFSTLNIELPEGVYDRMDINMTSGSAAGELPEIDGLYINITSGKVNLDYSHNNTPKHLKSHATSGSVVVNGFCPETYDIYSTSGTQNISGLGGSGSVRLVSGTANIEFAVWNGSLDVNITSGKAVISVPAGSGADFSFSRTSGSLNYDMDGDSGRMSSSGFASAGGSNRQKVNVSLTSGSVDVSTE